MPHSKNLTGGFLPMAVTAVTDDIYRAFYADYSEGKAFMHSHTYAGKPYCGSGGFWRCNASCARIACSSRPLSGRTICKGG